MRYSVEQQEEGIVVTIEDAAGQEAVLLDAVRNCGRAAHQGCAAECGKIASMEECGRESSVVLRLIPSPGERLEASRVKSCLQILWKQASS